ncbi:MAG: Ti-type conjugative transfer relaxase TraA [Frankiales bacterium]|nr:Ti-type conjugative transfer relaxase TraA [Frankiales bacterium]
MLSIGKLAPGPDAASYYLDRVGCPLDYYVGRGEAAGLWMGNGAQALGLSGTLDSPDAEQILRGLLDGVAPDGSRIVKPVLRADPRSRVPAADVVRAVQRAADSNDTDVEELLSAAASQELTRAWTRAVRDLEQARRRPCWPAPSLPAETASRLLQVAGLDPTTELGELTPTGRFRDRLARALRHREDRVDVRLPGLDLTFSAPKSVSVLYGLAGSDGAAGNADAQEQVAVMARDAHRVAVQAAIDYLELHCSTALRGHHRGDDTDTRIATRGLVAAAFEHRSSRCGDPQLHTHVVAANLLHAVDGKWNALDTREIYAQARTAGFVYQAVLRGELTRTLGVRWGEVRNGQAEMTGLPPGLLRLFSKRRVQIEAQLDLLGLDGSRAAQAATLATRPAKPLTSDPATLDETSTGERSLRQRWQDEAAAAGYPTDVLGRALEQISTTERIRAAHAAAAVSGPVADQLGDTLLAPTGLTQKKSTFDRKDLLRGVCEHLPAGTPISLTTLRALATRVLRDDRVVPLLGDVAVKSRRYSTRELLLLENDALELATASSQQGAAVVPTAVLQAAEQQAATAGLSQEQTVMLRQMLTSGAGVEVVVGSAGSGKTAALAVAAQAWRDAGLEVRGTALAAIAARVLQDSAAIPSVSLQRLLNDTLDPSGSSTSTKDLPADGVLIVDEAGMVGTRTLHQLMTLSQASNTKLVLVGDPKQLPEIDAGGLFATLAARLPAATLRGNQRQRQGWEQRALRELRDGDVLRAVSAYGRHDRLRITDTLGDLTTRILDDYEQAITEHAPEQVLLIASSRGDARRLNARLRERLLADGHLGPDELRIPLTDHASHAQGHANDGRERGYRLGEQVLVTANDYQRGLLNGTRGTITQLDLAQEQLTVRLDDGRHVQLESGYLRTGHLAHGYALTAHKAQGVTVDVSLLWGTHALTRETGYVAMSRGRHANYLYSTWDNLRRDTGDADLDRPLLRDRPDVKARRNLTRAALTERLGSSGRQRTARSWWRPRREAQPAYESTANVADHSRPMRERSG